MQSSKNWPMAIAVITLSTGAQATVDGYSTIYSACMDESGGMTMNMSFAWAARRNSKTPA